MNSTDLIALSALIVIFYIYRKLDKIKEFINDQFFGDDPSLSINSNGSRDIAQVLADNDKNYLVLFGSQTGTAEDYAKKFGKELTSKYQLNVLCADLENYDFDSFNDLPENVLVTFIISTYGEGDFPDGAIHFEQYLNELDSDSVSNIKFSIFGLGNTTYEFYNGAAKNAMEKLVDAGAELIGEIGLGDDGAGTTEEDYISWKEDTMEKLQSILGLHEQDTAFKASFEYTTLDTIDNTVSLGEPSKHYLPSNELFFNNEGQQKGPFDLSQPFITPIIKSRELFKDTDRNCIHSEFDISGSEITYKTGDHLAIWPSNSDEKVEQFLSVFQLNGKEIFNLKPLDSTIKLPFLAPTTIEAAVRNYIEITGPISRGTLSLLSQFAPSDIRNKVVALSKDKNLFIEEILSKKFNLADALLALNNGNPWTNIPWIFLIEVLPKLTPRYYSISSSSLSEPTVIHVTSIVENTPNEFTESNTVGVTTNLLRNIEKEQNNESTDSLPVHYNLNGPRDLYSGFKLPVHVRHSTFKLPTNTSIPVIMIGPGTGVAPFRGFIRERSKMVEMDNDLLDNMGKMLLFYGCRNENDFLYQEEWVEHSKVLDAKFELDVALSRVSEQKVYVQHKIAERKDEIAELLHQGAYVYVCGDAKRMARDVQNALVDILVGTKGISAADGQEIIKAMKVAGKYQEDVW